MLITDKITFLRRTLISNNHNRLWTSLRITGARGDDFTFNQNGGRSCQKTIFKPFNEQLSTSTPHFNFNLRLWWWY